MRFPYALDLFKHDPNRQCYPHNCTNFPPPPDYAPSSPNLVAPLENNRQSDILWIIILATVLVIVVLTLLGNFITLLAYLKVRTLRDSVSNIYVANLAFADFLIGIFVMVPMVSYTITNGGRWVFGEFVCHSWQVMDLYLSSVCLYSTCAVAVDRWFNLEKPLRIFKRCRRAALKTIAIIWILPFPTWVCIYSFCRLPDPEPDPETLLAPSPSHSCYFSWRHRHDSLLVASILFYVPMATLVVVLIRISSLISGHNRFLVRHASRASLYGSSRRIDEVTLTPGSLRSRDIGEFPAANGDLCSVPAVDASAKEPLMLHRVAASETKNLCRIREENAGCGGTNCRKKLSKSDLKLVAEGETNAIALSPGFIESEEMRRHSAIPCSTNSVHNSSASGADSGFSNFSRRSSVRKSFQKPDKSLGSGQKISENSSENISIDSGLGTPNLLKPVYLRNPLLRALTENDIEVDNEYLAGEAIPPECFCGGGAADRSANNSPRQNRATQSPRVTSPLRRMRVIPPLRRASTDETLLNRIPHLQRKGRYRAHSNAGFVDLRVAAACGGGPGGSRKGSALEKRFSISSINSGVEGARRMSLQLLADNILSPLANSEVGQQLRASKVVIVILFCFVVCWVPTLILWPLKLYFPGRVSDELYVGSIWVNYLNSAINPLLYALSSPKFKTALRKQITKICRRLDVVQIGDVREKIKIRV